jgi:hypothetical protein
MFRNYYVQLSNINVVLYYVLSQYQRNGIKMQGNIENQQELYKRQVKVDKQKEWYKRQGNVEKQQEWYTKAGKL